MFTRKTGSWYTYLQFRVCDEKTLVFRNCLGRVRRDFFDQVIQY